MEKQGNLGRLRFGSDEGGASVEEARANLLEALTLFFEVADELEISRRLHGEIFATQVEIPVDED